MQNAKFKQTSHREKINRLRCVYAPSRSPIRIMSIIFSQLCEYAIDMARILYKTRDYLMPSFTLLTYISPHSNDIGETNNVTGAINHAEVANISLAPQNAV